MQGTPRDHMPHSTMGRARLYKANKSKPRLPMARRKGSRIVFARGIPLASAMGTWQWKSYNEIMADNA